VSVLAAASADTAFAQSSSSDGTAPVRAGYQDSTLGDVRKQLAELQAKVAKLETAKAAAPTSTLSVGSDGFLIRSADKAFELRVRGYFQTDGRLRVGSESSPLTSTFLLRRMRPILEATMWRIMDFHLMPDFADSRLYDANFDLRLSKPFAIRAGKFKPPVGLERLQSAADIEFVERGLPTNLAPSRDVGVQAFGDARGGIVNYALGLFNGVPDLAVGDVDNGSTKDLAGRVLLAPWKTQSTSPLRGLTVGVSGSRGVQRGTTAAPFLPAYRSPSQQTVFAYRAGSTADATVVASGDHKRVYPQGTFYLGQFGAMGEYAVSSQLVRRGATSATLTHRAWQTMGTFVVTGENASYKGVVPKEAFDPSAHKWGALELVARVGALDFDKKSFPLYADPVTSVQREVSWGAGINWYLARSIRVLVDFDATNFHGGSATGDRPAEHVLMTRIQHGF
jgi:phosphate-selective porin OprO/OprP